MASYGGRGFDAAYYSRDFEFDMRELSANLATFDHKVERFVDNAFAIAETRGEAAMKLEAPWTQTGQRNRWGRLSTGYARGGLWAASHGSGLDRTLEMGHTAWYGVYLEEFHGKRFAIVWPILQRTGEALMRSLEGMFAQLDNPAPVVTVASPGGSARSFSQTAERRAERFTTEVRHTAATVAGAGAHIGAKAAGAAVSAAASGAKVAFGFGKKLFGSSRTKKTRRG